MEMYEGLKKNLIVFIHQESNYGDGCMPFIVMGEHDNFGWEQLRTTSYSRIVSVHRDNILLTPCHHCYEPMKNWSDTTKSNDGPYLNIFNVAFMISAVVVTLWSICLLVWRVYYGS